MFPVGDPVPDVTLTPVVGEMLQEELEILDPESVKLVALPVMILPPALLATARPLGAGQAGIATVSVPDEVAVASLQAPPVFVAVKRTV